MLLLKMQAMNDSCIIMFCVDFSNDLFYRCVEQNAEASWLVERNSLFQVSRLIVMNA